jgi:hypothetical protein
MTINFFSYIAAFLDEEEKKTPLFEQDSGVCVCVSIYFHDMIDERQND